MKVVETKNVPKAWNPSIVDCRKGIWFRKWKKKRGWIDIKLSSRHFCHRGILSTSFIPTRRKIRLNEAPLPSRIWWKAEKASIPHRPYKLYTQDSIYTSLKNIRSPNNRISKDLNEIPGSQKVPEDGKL